MPDISFADRVAVVTGGARGLGAAYVRDLAARGAAVVVHDNGAGVDGLGADPQPAQELAGEIVATGGRAVACVTDASTETGGQAAIDLALSEFGRLDVVVANAGIIHSAPLEEWPTERFEALLRDHLLAAFHVIRPAFAEMKAAGYGRLVLVSSAAGVFGQHGLTGYAAAKTAMVGLMNVAALEGAEFGIKANAILPMAGTRMAAALLGEAGQTPEALAFLDSMRCDQVAPVVAYLASERCEVTHHLFSAFRGRIAAVHIGVTKGWVSPGPFTAEDVATHLPQIIDESRAFLPGHIYDEVADVDAQLAGRVS